jgi:FtsP/CotA-like multicopper oxidase with cupredoxin domain
MISMSIPAQEVPVPQRRRRPLGIAATLVLAAATAVVAVAPSGQARAIAGSDEGILCEADTNNHTYSLVATSGYISTPDGNSIYSWSYTRDDGADGNGTGVRSFQLPGPTLCVNQGDTVTVKLTNTLREATSIVFSGQTDVKADGVAVAPQFGSTGLLTSLVQPAAAKTGTVTYTFIASTPGTYLYSSGSDVLKQHDMGLYGGLVVRPSGHADQANADSTSAFDTAHEYLYLLASMDPNLHAAVETNKTYAYTGSMARYFFINGRSMPDTIAPNNAAWMPSQPYGSMIHVVSETPGSKPALIRYVNASNVNVPFHPHGSDQTVVTRDGAALHDSAGNLASYQKFLVDVAPGQSYDTLMKWSNEYDADAKPISQGGTCAESAGANCKAIPSDIQLPQLQDQIVGPGTETWFSENPYIGGQIGTTPTGIVQNNVCGEYYHVAHSHALEQSTNYGASFGGYMTLIRIDPPNNTKC